jgi:hypothetical protein
MTAPVTAHFDALHVATTSGATLSGTNKFEEVSSFDLTINSDTVERKLLSGDGWTKVSSVFRSGSGSIEGNIIRGSVIQGYLKAASLDGSYLYITEVINAAAGVDEVKSIRYEVVVESYNEKRDGGALLPFTCSFKLNGSPTNTMGTAP